MKVEVVKSDEGVQIHLENEDGSKTVWLCDTEQAAIFKLANLLFSAQEDPKQAKRSILIGDFDAPEPKERPLAERAEKVREDLKKSGLAQKGGDMPDSDFKKFQDILKKMQDGAPLQPFLAPAIAPYNPNIHIYPASVPYQQPMQMPYIGDVPPFGNGFSIDVNVSGINTVSTSGLKEVELGKTVNFAGKLTTFINTSFGFESTG